MGSRIENIRYRNKHKLKLLDNERIYRLKNNFLINYKRRMKYAEDRLFIEKCKNKPCADCRGWFEPVCMDFDHRDPKTKKYHVTNMPGGYSLITIAKEIAKCDLVCSNCHRIRTERRGQYKYRELRRTNAIATMG